MNPEQERALELCRQLASLQPGATAPVSAETIDAIASRLGVVLPEAYRTVLREVGPIVAPVDLYAPDAVDRDPDAPWPARFVQFGSDGSELCFCFDLADPEHLVVVTWDLELPDREQELEGIAFIDWLEELTDEALEAARAEKLEARIAALEAALSKAGPHLIGPPAEHTALRDAQRALGGRLPASFAWYATHHGRALWPVTIFDVDELGRERAALARARQIDLEESPIPFARGGDSTLFAFERLARSDEDEPAILAFSPGSDPTPSRASACFFDWLESAIASASAAANEPRSPVAARPPMVRRRSPR